MISNSVIVRFAEVIFTNTNRDVRRTLPMAGRRDERKKFLDVSGRDGRQIVTMSGLLGSGKTFFLLAMLAELIRNDGFPELRNSEQVFGSSGGATVEQLQLRFADADPKHRCIVLLEELDRKGEYSTLMTALHEALGWLRSSHDGLLVLTGDRFLEHPSVAQALAESDLPVTAIDLEGLDRELLTEAIALRLADASPSLGDGFPIEEARRASESILTQPKVARRVLPPTEPPIANFREALGLLKAMTSNLVRVDDRVEFPSDLSDGRIELPRLTLEQRRIDDHVIELVKQSLEFGGPVRPLALEDLRTIAGSTLAERDFIRRVSNPLVTSQVLEPNGVPYLHEDEPNPDMKYVGPYLPRQSTFRRGLRALQAS